MECSELLRAALDALVYHSDQTRPIHSTQMTIQAIRDFFAGTENGDMDDVEQQFAMSKFASAADRSEAMMDELIRLRAWINKTKVK